MKIFCGVYLCKNLVNDKVYVGSAANVLSRWVGHEYALRRGDHSNRHLQNAWNKYGEDKFNWSVLERCSKEDQYTVELKWIEHYNSVDPNLGYNKSYPIRGAAPCAVLVAIHKQYWENLTEEEKNVRIDHLLDPKRNRASISKTMKEKWANDTEFREQRIDGLNRGREKTNARLKEDDQVLAQYQDLAANARSKMKWTPEKRKAQSERARKQMLDPAFREKQKLALAAGRAKQTQRALAKQASKDIV